MEKRQSAATRAVGWIMLSVAAGGIARAETTGGAPSVQPPDGIVHIRPAGRDALHAAATAETALPALQPGLWEYQRTLLMPGSPRPQHSSIKKCSDPSREIRGKLAELKQKGCRFSPISSQGNQYHSSWTCPIAGGGLLSAHNVVTVRSTSSYREESEIREGDRTTRSTLIASRIGDCPG